ncbi:MAG: hypothetical protein A2176_15450 [Spirochaetes bacterium RBG_13_51_14]|nr:MAG: hypothetical protein A2176_15450 [Spirochaetes bacterium RBG_13_51_14]
MKKYILIGTFACIGAVITLFLYQAILARNAVDDEVRLEDSIIIHGIEMESETPIAENDDEYEGQIIYDDSFDDTINKYDQVKKKKNAAVISHHEKNAFDTLRSMDKRWHLCRYKIKKMDNLWNIARRFGVHQHLIISINEIKNPDMLKPGKYIDVPTRKGIYYQVRKGDTLSGIARRYAVSTGNIIEHNRLKGAVIRPGQKIFLPGARERSDARIIARNKRRGPDHVAAQERNFIWPLRGRITSGFGNRLDPLTRDSRFHCGIDISANVGTPVRTAGGGRIIYSGWKAGYGKCVIVRHEGGYITVYAHNSRNVVSVDDTVKRGELIAYSGMTGAVTGAHLHFEIRKYVNPLNPMRFLR